MRARSVVLLIIALGCGLVASIGITQVMAKRGSTPSQTPIQTTQIFVALKDIPMGDPITPDMLKLEEWPKDKVPKGAITKLEDVEGRRPKTKIYAGSPILASQLLGKGESFVDPTEHIPPGYRVVSVKVDEVIGAGRLIKPGDRVDLLVFMQKNPSRGIMETCTRTILQDIKVFAVGSTFDLAEAEEEKSVSARTVSLLVTPEQAEIVMLATELGSIRLVLRSPEDRQIVDLPGSYPHELGRLAQKLAEAGDTNSEPPPTTVTPTATTPQTGQDFLAFLRMQQQLQQLQPSTGKPVEEPAESGTWSMRIIRGPEVQEVVLSVEPAATEQRDQGDGSSSFSFWRIFTGQMHSSDEATTEEASETVEEEPQPEPEEPDSPPLIPEPPPQPAMPTF